MRILIPILVGSLIGYMTNWLAIKMLFKPHYKKKIFGISLPFTPGLIPKERMRIAENIGNAVGTHLLSTDTIIEAMSNKENEERIKEWMIEKIENLKENDTKINDYLVERLGEEYKIRNNNVGDKLSGYLVDFIRKENVKSSLKYIIDESIDRYDTKELYQKIEMKAKDFTLEYRDSDDFSYEVESFLKSLIEKAKNNEKTIEEIIPDEIFSSIDKYLKENKDEIGDKIRDIFKDEEVKSKIEESISNIVFDRSNKILMAFVGPHIITEKIVETIEKYIEKRETNEDIIEIIRFSIAKAKLQKLSNVSTSLNKVIDEISLSNISTKIIELVFKDENIDISIKRLLNILRENETLAREILKDNIWKEFEKIISSDYMEDKIRDAVEDAINLISNKKISDIFTLVNDSVISNIYDFFKKIFNRLAKYELPNIIEMLNVSKIVEDKINSFEIDYTEKLILDIAKKELNQITRLGALLGAILGLLSPFLQNLY